MCKATKFFSICLMVLILVPTIFGQEITPEPRAQLDINAQPQYRQIALNPDFQEPYVIEELVVNEVIGAVEQVNLNNYQGDLSNAFSCTGFTTTAPTLKIEWRSTRNNNHLLFSFESNSVDDHGDQYLDATIFVHIEDFTDDSYSNWCNDDFYGQPNPLVEIDELSGAALIYIWMGSYHPQETITGTLYISRSLTEIPNLVPTPTKTFGSIQSTIQRLGAVDMEQYCLQVLPNYPYAHHLRNDDLSWGCWDDDEQVIELDLTAVCSWQYGMGSYVVQEGNAFESYACYRRTDNPSTTASPTPHKEDYSDWGLPVGENSGG